MAERPVAPAWRWVSAEAAIVWAVAAAAFAARLAPGVAQRAGLVAVLAGLVWGAFLVARRWRPEEADLAAGRLDLVLLGCAVVASGLLHWLATSPGVPLGYDYGFYKVAFEAYEGGVPSQRPPWLDAQFEPGLPALHAVLHGVAGLTARGHLTWLWVALSTLAVPAAFVLARAWGGTRAGLVAAGATAVSFTQAQAHAYLYEKNLLALVLLGVALFLLARRSWIAAGVAVAAVAAMNRPTALLAALALPLAALPALRRDWRGWATAGGVALALGGAVALGWPETFFDTGRAVAVESAGVLASGATAGTGTFFEPKEYLLVAAAYLPFAVAALAFAWRSPTARLPAVAAVVAGLYVALALPLHLRFLLMLDAAALVLAGPALVGLVPAKGWATGAAAALVIALAAVPTVREALDPETPHTFVTAAQFGAIVPLAAVTDTNATLLADNLRAPYVLAESGRRTSGPGLFDDPHDRAQWTRFFSGLEGDDLRAFMQPYGPDVYVVQAEVRGPDWSSATVKEPAFALVAEDGGLRLWRWTGGAA